MTRLWKIEKKLEGIFAKTETKTKCTIRWPQISSFRGTYFCLVRILTSAVFWITKRGALRWNSTFPCRPWLFLQQKKTARKGRIICCMVKKQREERNQNQDILQNVCLSWEFHHKVQASGFKLLLLVGYFHIGRHCYLPLAKVSDLPNTSLLVEMTDPSQGKRFVKLILGGAGVSG